MYAVFEAVFSLFAFGIIGFILAKLKIVNSEHSKILSSLLVYVFLPCNILITYIKNFNIPYLQKNYFILIVSSVIIIAVATVFHFVAKLFSKKKYEQAIFAFALTVANTGYMGYPIAQALLSETGFMNAMVFTLPMGFFYINSVGFCRLTKRKLTPKCLLNAAFIPVIVGGILGILRFNPPEVVWSILDSGSSCMGPASMLMAGMVVSEFKIKPLLCNVHTYVVSALRLLVIPITLGLIASLFLDKEIVQIIVLLYSMPCALNTIVLPRFMGENCEIGASHALVSNTAACITIPIVMSLFGI